MKKIIKYHLLIESRLEDAKKKWHQLPPTIIDKISSKDPSGNNKYLNWMLAHVYQEMVQWKNFEQPNEGEYVTDPRDPNTYSSSINSTIDYLIRVVDSFHKNVDRLTPERVYEALVKRVGHIPNNFTIVKLNDSIHLGGEKLGVWESKNINVYSPHTLGQVLSYIINHYPSKGELDKIKNQETINIYEDDNIKIVAPQSFASSCMYGAETRWCTTSKQRPEHFNDYTKKNMALIYFIFKKPMKMGPLFYKAGLGVVHGGEDVLFKKMALHVNLKSKIFSWYDEWDVRVKGLSLLKTYIDIQNRGEFTFSNIKNKINEYLKTKDERSSISRILKPRRVRESFSKD